MRTTVIAVAILASAEYASAWSVKSLFSKKYDDYSIEKMLAIREEIVADKSQKGVLHKYQLDRETRHTGTYQQDCPAIKVIKSADIELVTADGKRVELDPKLGGQTVVPADAKSLSDINSIIYIYDIKKGRCGKIVAERNFVLQTPGLLHRIVGGKPKMKSLWVQPVFEPLSPRITDEMAANDAAEIKIVDLKIVKEMRDVAKAFNLAFGGTPASQRSFRQIHLEAMYNLSKKDPFNAPFYWVRHGPKGTQSTFVEIPLP